MALCREGKSLTQIADELGVLKQELIHWSKDKIRKKEFAKAFLLGKQACQAYHENLYEMMVQGLIKVDSKSKELQAYKLRVMFKDDWSEKQESKVEITTRDLDKLSPKELQAELQSSASKPHARKILEQILQSSSGPKLEIVPKGK